MEPRSEQTTETTEQVKQQTQQVAQYAQQAASQAVEQAQQQATSLTATQKDRAATSLTTVATALRQTGQRLEEQDQRIPSRVMTTAARQVERLAGYLESRDVSQLIGDAETIAREQPILFLGGAVAAGFLASRFLKSSPPREPQETSAGVSD